MNLYSVKGGIGSRPKILKIKSKTVQLAIIKFMDEVNEVYHIDISATLFCEMTDIIEA